MPIKKANNSLNRVRKHFPQVTRVVDSKESITVAVNKKDVSGGRRKDPGQCALARACMREQNADGAIINLTFSYIIRGKTATRYKTSTGVGREIVSFDRHGDFAEGKNYRLSSVSASSRLDRERSEASLKSGKKNSVPSYKGPMVHSGTHQTVRVRRARKG